MPRGALEHCTIVFDLDGTLADTAPDLLTALNKVMDLEGLARPDERDVRQMVGHGARRLIEAAAGRQGRTYPPERLRALTETFIDFYASDIASGTRLFPGVEEAMDALTRHGAILSVCTNKRQNLSEQVLEALGVKGRFQAIVGADAVTNRKPHPDHFREAVSRAGGRADRALMVGDSSADVDSAKAAGAPVVAVSFGYSTIPAHDLGADALITSYLELEAHALRLLG